MVSLYLVDSKGKDTLDSKALVFAKEHVDFGNSKILFMSRRPALMPYVDPVVAFTSRVLFMAYHLFSSQSQKHQLTIDLAERVAFPKDSLLPASAFVEVEAGQDIQIYSTELTMTAKLHGLRWLMVHYRLLTYVVFTMLFWSFEVLFMSAAWTLYSSSVSSKDGQGRMVTRGRRRGGTAGDTEEDDDSHDDEDDDLEEGDAPSQQPRLGSSRHAKAEYGIKDEQGERLLADIPAAGAEADDEFDYGDEDEGTKEEGQPSGMATSYREEGQESIRRRASRNL
jgi:hypothetical protein